MKYPEPLAHLISFIPDDVYADKEKEITEIADGIAKDRARLKKEMLEDVIFYGDFGERLCRFCEERITKHHPDCIVRQLQEEKE